MGPPNVSRVFPSYTTHSFHRVFHYIFTVHPLMFHRVFPSYTTHSFHRVFHYILIVHPLMFHRVFHLISIKSGTLYVSPRLSPRLSLLYYPFVSPRLSLYFNSSPLNVSPCLSFFFSVRIPIRFTASFTLILPFRFTASFTIF